LSIGLVLLWWFVMQGVKDRSQERAASQQKVLAVLGQALWPATTEHAAGITAGLSDLPDGLPADWAPGGRWGLGTARCLKHVTAHFGIDFAAKTVCEAALRGWLPYQAFPLV
jgi:hypothetical protein